MSAQEPTPPKETAAKQVRDALSLDSERCAGGDARACMRAALQRQHGDRATVDIEEALSLHRRACALGERRSCAHAATLTLRGRLYGDETASALAAAISSCDQGYPTACIFLLTLRHRARVFEEVLRPKILATPNALRSACRDDDDDACAAGLEMIKACARRDSWECDAMDLELRREDRSGDPRIALATRPFAGPLRERCAAARPRSCALLADYGAPMDGERLHRDACMWGYAPSCLRDAGVLTGVGSEAERAAALKRACDAGLQRGCSELLQDEIRREGATVERLREGCELQDASLCTALARTLMNSGETARAEALYEHACDLGDADGCDAVGLLGSPESIIDEAELLRRKGWFVRACELRGTDFCERPEAIERAYALGAELTACRAGEIERCPRAIEVLALQDSKAASELVDTVLKRSGEACRSSSDACTSIQWIYQIIGCGERGIQRCAEGTAAAKRQYRRSLAFEASVKRLERAECKRGEAGSCQMLANDLSGRDDQRAEELYRRACELGDATSCDQAWSVADGHRYVAEAEIVKYHEMACTARDHRACLSVAGHWAESDPRLSEVFRARARALIGAGCPVPPSPDATWCGATEILRSLGELGMYESVVDAMRRACHGTGDWEGACRMLVGALRVPLDPWT